jgi:hypothetical protein
MALTNLAVSLYLTEYIGRQMKPVAPSKSWELTLGALSLSRPDTPHPMGAVSSALALVGKERSVLMDRRSEPEPAPMTRRKIWDLGASLHCSIVGTCLSAGELRTLVRKFQTSLAEKPTDHELHTIAVSAISHRDLLAKQIQKALDRRHASCIRHFADAKSPDELRHLWNEARQTGDIPGAYWAVLTHPRTSDALVRQSFGDVHMLSHLVGAANRADIRRLHQLEEEKAALEEKLARQQLQLRDGIVARDAKIRELNAALSARIEQQNRDAAPAESDEGSERETLQTLIGDLRKLLDREVQRRERAEKRIEEALAAQGKSEQARLLLEEEATVLRAELDAVEARLASADAGEETADDLNLAGITLLYVGGRPHQVARLRSLVEQASGQLIHHDGGIEERADLLPGLVSRANAAFFPVDCISHRAALTLKRHCQQAGKPFIPLRSASLASMLRALRSPDIGLMMSSRSAAE